MKKFTLNCTGIECAALVCLAYDASQIKHTDPIAKLELRKLAERIYDLAGVHYGDLQYPLGDF